MKAPGSEAPKRLRNAANAKARLRVYTSGGAPGRRRSL